jgi:hypothetical protein
MQVTRRTFLGIGGVSMSKRSEAEANRAADGSKNASQFCKRAELGLDADGLQDALAACWTGLLSRVKERSEAARSKEMS